MATIRAPAFGPLAAPQLRAVLTKAGFTDPGWQLGLPATNLAALSPTQHTTLVRRTSGATPLQTLVRLFVLGVEVDGTAAREAVAPTSLQDWLDSRLLVGTGDAVRAGIQLRPHGNLWMASDVMPPRGTAGEPGHVLAVAMASDLLSNLTVRRSGQRTLDLCTGSGIQALRAAAHSQHVVAVDLNPRALEFARFNAELNAIDNIEWREGDLFGPVGDETFDLVTANPPFVPAPSPSVLFRDSPLPGDEFSRQVVRGAAERLAPGGTAHVVCTWTGHQGEPVEERVAGWLDDIGCDLWVLEHGRFDPAGAANRWLPITDGRVDPKSASEWVAHYGEMGVDTVALGVIILRQRVGPGRRWTRYEVAQPQQPCGDDLLQGFEVLDWSANRPGPAALLGARLVINPGAILTMNYAVGASRWEAGLGSIGLPGGLGRSSPIDSVGAAMMARFDGRSTTADVIYAEARDQGLDLALFRSEVLSAIRPMVENGFLLPVDM